MTPRTPPKRKAIPVGVKLAAALRMLGFAETEIEWHHSPPLGQRPYDEHDYDPPQLDPDHIEIMPKDAHRKRTAEIDVPAIAKSTRITTAHERFKATLLAKATGDDPPRVVKRHVIRSRGFDKRHRPMRSRKFEART